MATAGVMSGPVILDAHSDESHWTRIT